MLRHDKDMLSNVTICVCVEMLGGENETVAMSVSDASSPIGIGCSSPRSFGSSHISSVLCTLPICKGIL